MKKGTNKETVQGLLDNTWDSYPPEFYITFHWKNCPRELKTVINDTKFFNNIFYSCGPGGFTIIRRIISYVKAL